MYSRALFLTFILDLIVTVNPIPRPDVGLFALDDESLTIPASDEQTFDISSPVEVSDSGTDLFSLEDCSDNANIPGPFWDDALQARGNTCSNAPPETKSSADGENTNNSGESGNSPSSEKLNSDLYDNSFQPDNDPLKHTFSLPQDYDDERCREFGFIRYAVCSSGDYRDEARSTAYNFFPVQAYRLSRCSFSKFWPSSRDFISIDTGKIPSMLFPFPTAQRCCSFVRIYKPPLFTSREKKLMER